MSERPAMIKTVALWSLALGASSVAAFTPEMQPKANNKPMSQMKAIAMPLPGQNVGLPPPPVADVSSSSNSQALAPEDAWIANLDYEGFGREVTDLGKQLLKEGGDADVEHLNKIVSWRNIAAMLGVATLWMGPNPLTIAALSTWTYASWTMIAHHTCHGGYNRMDAGKFNSRGFALGSVAKRVSEWCDWMKPEAWNLEHNRLHHYRLNENSDPDLVQRNLEFLRQSDEPMWQKYLTVMLYLPTWKWAYYAPNTYKELKIAEFKKEGIPLPENFDPFEAATVSELVGRSEVQAALREVVKPNEFFTKVVGPFLLTRFVLLPAPLLLVPGIGPTLFAHGIVNLVLAEMLTNVHAFVTIVTNHCGEDLYTFDDAVKPKTPSFYVRQIVGSANYDAGNDLIDFSHGWLNYQIEHHVWPDLSMRQYQKGAPRLKAICEKYGVPYIQENVFERTRKTLDIMVGKTKMRTFPTQYEPAKDKAGASGVTWKSTNGAIDE